MPTNLTKPWQMYAATHSTEGTVPAEYLARATCCPEPRSSVLVRPDHDYSWGASRPDLRPVVPSTGRDGQKYGLGFSG